jgi:uncharacterized Ntn-hydrolase superfamily protein
MTWSIVAHDPRTGAFAVATAALAVGASCPFLRPGVGAVSTQSLTNRYLGPAILDRRGRGLAPEAAIDGNMLAAAAVDATFDALGNDAELELPERLLAALDAGQDMGGDRCGRQSAAMLLTTREDFPDLDIRVDDHREPLAELHRLLAIWRRHTLFRKMWAPTKANPSGATDLDAIERAWWEEGLDRFPRPVGRSPRRSNPME